jgi:hypothetical protein
MTRRQFGAILFGGSISVRSMSTRNRVSSKRVGRFKHHIENVRLFRFAAGEASLDKWERKHLHECDVCQKMACVLIYQLINSAS